MYASGNLAGGQTFATGQKAGLKNQALILERRALCGFFISRQHGLCFALAAGVTENLFPLSFSLRAEPEGCRTGVRRSMNSVGIRLARAVGVVPAKVRCCVLPHAAAYSSMDPRSFGQTKGPVNLMIKQPNGIHIPSSRGRRQKE